MKKILACLPGIAVMAVAAGHFWQGPDDFRQFYRAASLARAHQSVFDRPTFSPATNSESYFLPYNRNPAYALALEPLASLPYATARRVWVVVISLAFMGCVWLFPGRRGQFAMALAFSFPVALTLYLGQDIGFTVLIALAAARVYSTDREFAAGLVASLTAIKFTYLPAVSLVFLAKSRRGSVGLAVGVALQLATSYAMEGVRWPSVYSAQIHRSFEIFAAVMPNIRTLATLAGLPGAVYVIGGVLLMAWLWLACRRLSLPGALMVALALALIASPYGFAYDCVVIVPLAASVASLDSWEGMLAGSLLTPIPWFMILSPGPVLAPAASVLVVISTLAATGRFLKMRSAAAAGVTDAGPACTKRLVPDALY
jgi:glycosyl transferase family 87